MIKSALFLLVLVAVVNSDEEGNFLAAGDEGEGNFLAAGDEGEGGFIADSVGDYFAVVRDTVIDPITAKDIIELPTRLARSNLSVGQICTTCRLLDSIRTTYIGVPGQIRIRDIRFFKSGVRIQAVRADQIGSSPSANPRIVAGGINSDTVTVRFTSGLGQGFDYRLRVYGI